MYVTICYTNMCEKGIFVLKVPLTTYMYALPNETNFNLLIFYCVFDFVSFFAIVHLILPQCIKISTLRYIFIYFIYFDTNCTIHCTKTTLFATTKKE